MRKALRSVLVTGVVVAGLAAAGPASAQSWQALPDEVIQQMILPGLSERELLRACQVDKRMQRLCNDPIVWLHRLDKLPAEQIDKLADRWQDHADFPEKVAAERARRTVTTIAGTYQQGHSQDGTLATASPLFLPTAIAIDTAGNIIFGEDRRVYRINAEGKLALIAGNGQQGAGGDGGPAIHAQLSSPHGLAVDNNGNIYISDFSEGVIRRVDASGNISTLVAPGQLNSPGQLAMDNAGNILLADRGAHMVYRIHPTTGALTPVAGTGQQADGGNAGGPIGAGDGGPAINAPLNVPSGVAMDHDGNILITESFGHRLRKIDTSGNITTVAHLNYPQAVTVDAAGTILVTESINGRVLRIDPTTGASTVVATGLSRPRGITMDAHDNVLVADQDNSRIVRFGIQR